MIARGDNYVLGHSEAAILRPISERLSRGIQPGMRVLDLGSGIGDVAMLAAELVGPSGWVVGIDRNPQAISIATQRARDGGLHHLAFHEAEADTVLRPLA